MPTYNSRLKHEVRSSDKFFGTSPERRAARRKTLKKRYSKTNQAYRLRKDKRPIVPYYVYILRCRDNSLYVGITKNPVQRMALHSLGKGSKYVRSRLPFEVVFTRKVKGRSAALKGEAYIRKMTKEQKEAFITHTTARKEKKDHARLIQA